MSTVLFVVSSILLLISFIFGSQIPQEVGNSSLRVANIEALLFCCSFIISSVICFVGGMITLFLEKNNNSELSWIRSTVGSIKDNQVTLINHLKQATPSHADNVKQTVPPQTDNVKQATPPQTDSPNTVPSSIKTSSYQRNRKSTSIPSYQTIVCRNCGKEFTSDKRYCPYCWTDKNSTY